MTRSVVLLRGVNLGKHNRISMPDFRTLLEGVGCREVQTYVQSGNAVVEHDAGPAELERLVAAALTEHGLPVPVMVRTGDELARVVEASPWQDLDPKLFHVAFLSGDPDPEKVAAIDHEALLPERVVVGERRRHEALQLRRHGIVLDDGVAALDVRAHLPAADALQEPREGRHRDAVVAADVDAPQQDHLAGHRWAFTTGPGAGRPACGAAAPRCSRCPAARGRGGGGRP